MDVNPPLVAGAVATVIYACGTLPMVVKAGRTKDLRSYSLGHIVLANVGNLINSVYVFGLPMGPVWLLHTFYLVTTGLMLFWYLRYTELPTSRAARKVDVSADAVTSDRSLASVG